MLNIDNVVFSFDGHDFFQTLLLLLRSLAKDVFIMGRNYSGLKIGANMDLSPRNLKIRQITLPKLSMWQINGI